MECWIFFFPWIMPIGNLSLIASTLSSARPSDSKAESIMICTIHVLHFYNIHVQGGFGKMKLSNMLYRAK
jgi:hypothetical protein